MEVHSKKGISYLRDVPVYTLGGLDGRIPQDLSPIQRFGYNVELWSALRQSRFDYGLEKRASQCTEEMVDPAYPRGTVLCMGGLIIYAHLDNPNDSQRRFLSAEYVAPVQDLADDLEWPDLISDANFDPMIEALGKG